MRIAQIAFQYGTTGRVGGACIAASRLHKTLLAHGIESHFLCWEALESGENIHVLPKGWKRGLYYLLSRCSHYGWSLTPYRKPIPLNLFPVFGFEDELKHIDPDVVHIQWINEDFPSLSQFANVNRPVIVNLHDCFIFNAIDPYPGLDRRFVIGFEGGDSTVIERWVFKRKRLAVMNARPIFVGPSNWICEEAKLSIIGRNSVIEVLQNPVSADFFYHQEWCFQHHKMIIVFGCSGGTKNFNKGWDDLLKAVLSLTREMRERIAIRVFGEDSASFEIDGCEVSFAGVVNDPADLCRFYHSGDVFALPSRLDNAPQTKFEALMCGLPVIAFRRTGCAEHIDHCVNGWIAADGDVAGFAAGIEYFCRLYDSGELPALKAEIARSSRVMFSDENVVKRATAIYERAVRGYRQ